MLRRISSDGGVKFEFPDGMHDALGIMHGFVPSVPSAGISDDGLPGHLPPMSPDSAVSVSERLSGRTSVTAMASCSPEGMAMRAGFPCGLSAGGLSLVLILDSDMPLTTMSRAAVTATEAVTAVLQDCDARDAEGRICSGWADQRILVVRDRGSGLYLRGAGKHSKLGQLIGEAVYEAVSDAMSGNYGGWESGVAGMLARRGYDEETLFMMSGCDDRAGFTAALYGMPPDGEVAAVVSAALHLADEASWGLVPEAEARSVAHAILSGAIGPMPNGANIIEDIAVCVAGHVASSSCGTWRRPGDQ